MKWINILTIVGIIIGVTISIVMVQYYDYKFEYYRGVYTIYGVAIFILSFANLFANKYKEKKRKQND